MCNLDKILGKSVIYIFRRIKNIEFSLTNVTKPLVKNWKFKLRPPLKTNKNSEFWTRPVYI